MNRIKIGLIALCLTLATTWDGRAEIIKLGTLAPEGSPWYDTLRDVAEAWHVASDGSIEVRIYPGGVAGDDASLIRKVRIGQLQAAAVTTDGLSRVVPDIMALHLPMLVRSDEEFDYLKSQVLGDLEAQFAAVGLKVLNWTDAGWIRFFCNVPVSHPNDLRPLKIFVWAGDTASAQAWRDSGYQPVPLAATDILGALQSGMIDCVPTVPVAALSFQWFGLARHMTELRLAPFMGATVISERTWRSISEPLRASMVLIAQDHGRRLQERVRALDQEAIEVMQQYGLEVHEVSEDAVTLWEADARAGYESYRGAVVSPEFLARIEQILSEHRAR